MRSASRHAEATTTRARAEENEEKDRPLFTNKVKELCPDCKIFYQNASQDPNKQQQQAEAAITKGASVIVLDAVDVSSVGPIVQHANQKNIPVIAYDRLIPDQDIAFYVSFDNVKQGRVQAQSLLDKLGSADGKSIVMVNGAATDPSAGDQGAGRDGAVHHLARQGRVRGRLLRERRHGRRHHRRAEGRRHPAAGQAGHRR